MVKYFDGNDKEVHYGEQFNGKRVINSKNGTIVSQSIMCPINNETIPMLIKDNWIVQKEVEEEKEYTLKNLLREIMTTQGNIIDRIVELENKVDKLSHKHHGKHKQKDC